MIWPLSIVHQHSTGLGFHGRLLQHAPAEPPYHWLPHTWGICYLLIVNSKWYQNIALSMILYRKALIQGGNTTAKRRGTTRSFFLIIIICWDMREFEQTLKLNFLRCATGSCMRRCHCLQTAPLQSFQFTRMQTQRSPSISTNSPKGKHKWWLLKTHKIFRYYGQQLACFLKVVIFFQSARADEK